MRRVALFMVASLTAVLTGGAASAKATSPTEQDTPAAVTNPVVKTPAWILELSVRGGAQDHLINVLCMAADYTLLMRNYGDLSEAEVESRTAANQRLGDAAIASGATLGFTTEEVVNQISSYMSFLEEGKADLRKVQADCATLKRM